MQIELGVLADNLSVQFEKAGVSYCGTQPLEILQRSSEAISLLYIQGYLSETEAEKARKRVLEDVKVRKKTIKTPENSGGWLADLVKR